MRCTPPLVGLNFLPEDDFRVAAMPLFEAGVVDALETDIDATWGYSADSAPRIMPAWIATILEQYANDDLLYGHGVWLSVMSGRWTSRQEMWMERLAAEVATRRYQHVSEHFGWMTSGAYWRNTLLPIAKTRETVAIGIDRMQRLAEVAACRVGLENLGTHGRIVRLTQSFDPDRRVGVLPLRRAFELVDNSHGGVGCHFYIRKDRAVRRESPRTVRRSVN